MGQSLVLVAWAGMRLMGDAMSGRVGPGILIEDNQSRRSKSPFFARDFVGRDSMILNYR